MPARIALVVIAIAFPGAVEAPESRLLSLLGVIFEIYVTYVELFVIGAVCVWCASYGLSLLLRFGVALFVWRRRMTYSPGSPLDRQHVSDPGAPSS